MGNHFCQLAVFNKLISLIELITVSFQSRILSGNFHQVYFALVEETISSCEWFINECIYFCSWQHITYIKRSSIGRVQIMNSLQLPNRWHFLWLNWALLSGKCSLLVSDIVYWPIAIDCFLNVLSINPTKGGYFLQNLSTKKILSRVFT